MSKSPRWLGPTLFMFGVVLMGAGITGMLGVSYDQHPSWIMVSIPPIAMIVGCVFLLAPLLSRLSREASDDDPAASPGASHSGPPPSR